MCKSIMASRKFIGQNKGLVYRRIDNIGDQLLLVTKRREAQAQHINIGQFSLQVFDLIPQNLSVQGAHPYGHCF